MGDHRSSGLQRDIVSVERFTRREIGVHFLSVGLADGAHLSFRVSDGAENAFRYHASGHQTCNWFFAPFRIVSSVTLHDRCRARKFRCSDAHIVYCATRQLPKAELGPAITRRHNFPGVLKIGGVQE